MNRQQAFLDSGRRDHENLNIDETPRASFIATGRHGSNTSAILIDLEEHGHIDDNNSLGETDVFHESKEDLSSSPPPNTNGDSMIDFCALDWSKRIEDSRRQDLESGDECGWSSSEEGDESGQKEGTPDAKGNPSKRGGDSGNDEFSNENEDAEYNDAKSYASNSEADESYASDENAEIKMVFGVVFWMLVQRVGTKFCEYSYKYLEKVFQFIKRCCKSGKEDTDQDAGNLQNVNNQSANANSGAPNQPTGGNQASSSAQAPASVAGNMAVAASQSAAGAGGT